MGLLDGGIASLFGQAFGQFYLDGNLTRTTLIGDDSGGGTASYSNVAVKVQMDSCTEAMRAQAGYTDTDVRLLILHSPLGSDIQTDDKVSVGGSVYAIASVAQDPARSYWECRGQVLSRNANEC